MNIAFYIHQFPKLSETFIINQVVGLLKRGHDVTVFANKLGSEDVKHHLVEEYNLRERTELVGHLDSVRSGIEMSITSISSLLKRNPLLIGEIPRSVLQGRIAPSYLASLDQYLSNSKSFDIHHAHFGTIGLQWIFLNRHTDVPFVTTFYGFDVSSYVHPNNYDAYSRFWSAADCCLGITHHIRSRMISLGCPEQKATKHPIGVDLTKFDHETKRYHEDRPLRLVTVARLTEKKGLRYGINAVADCIQDGIDLRYRLGGDGELRATLEQQVRNRGIKNSVTFEGWLTQAEVDRILDWGDVFLLPSVTAQDGDMEGQALVIQEAQAKGLPVISTYHDGIPEGVLEGKTAKLVPERSVKGLVSGIKHFIGGDQLEQYSSYAERFIRKNFDNRHLLDRQVEIYRNLRAREVDF